MIDIRNQFCLRYVEVGKYVESHYEKEYQSTRDSSIIICFNGSFKCAATVLMYQQMGWRIELLYVRMNEKEMDRSVRVAKRLGYTLNIVDVPKGTSCVKQFRPILACELAVAWAIEHDMPVNIAVGTYDSQSIHNIWGIANLSDCRELYESYSKIKGMIVDNFSVRRILPQASVAWDVMLGNPGILEEVDVNEHLLYIIEADFNKRKFDQETYQFHLDKLMHSSGTKSFTGKPYSVEEFYKYYMFYPFDRSALYRAVMGY